MHPLIAFLSFLFSPASDWTLQQGFDLVLNPYEVPAIVEQVNRLDRKYPTPTADARAKAMWAEVLQTNQNETEAQKIWTPLLNSDHLDQNEKDNIALRLGESHFQKGQLDEAKVYFNQVIKNRGPRMLDGMTNLLVVALTEQDKEEILHHSEGIKSMAPNPEQYPQAIFPLGLAAYSERNYSESLAYLNKLEDSKARYFAGLAHRHLKQEQDALAQWQKIQREDPHSQWNDLAQFQVAETYFAMGDENLSKQACERSLAQNPTTSLANKFIFRLATIDVNAGQYDAALARLDEIKQDNDLIDRTIVLAAESMIKTGRSEELVDAMAQFKDREDISVDRRYQKAYAALFNNQLNKAIDQAEHGLEEHFSPEITPRLLLVQGIAQEKQGQQAEAFATYQTVADYFPNTLSAAKATHWLVRGYMRLGRTQEAMTHGIYQWNKLSEDMKRQHPDTALWLAEAHIKENAFASADKFYQEFLTQADPKHKMIPNAQFQRSVTLAHLGRTPEAMDILDEYAQNNDPALATIQKGHIAFNQKMYEDAIAYYRASHTNPKSFYYEGLALARLEYYTDAIETWTTLAEAHPQHALSEPALFKAGRTQFELGLASQAVTTFAQFMETYPGSAQYKDAMFQQAHAFYAMNEPEQASEKFKAYVARYNKPEDLVAAAPYLAAAYIQMNKSPDEIDQLMRGLPPTNEVASLHWEAGATSYNETDFAKANHHFSTLLSQLPASETASKAWFFRAESLYLNEDWPAAEQAYSSFKNLSANPENQDVALFRQAITLHQQRDLVNAIESYETFLRTYPQNALVNDAKENLKICYTGLGNFEARDAVDEIYPSVQEPKRQVVELTEEEALIARRKQAAPATAAHFDGSQ